MKLSRLVPMQPVGNMPASVAFYEKLGFVVESRNDEWGWAMLRCGDCRIMLDQSINPHAGIPRISVLYLYPRTSWSSIATLGRTGCLFQSWT